LGHYEGKSEGNFQVSGDLDCVGFFSGGLFDKCLAYRDSSQGIGNNSQTAIQLNQEKFDTNTMHDNSTNNTRITIKRAGYYQISGLISFERASYQYEISLRINGSSTIARLSQPYYASITNGQKGLFISKTVYMGVNDYIELCAWQNSGSTRDISSGEDRNYLDVRRVP
jgi:hypothetical protein